MFLGKYFSVFLFTTLIIAGTLHQMSLASSTAASRKRNANNKLADKELKSVEHNIHELYTNIIQQFAFTGSVGRHGANRQL